MEDFLPANVIVLGKTDTAIHLFADISWIVFREKAADVIAKSELILTE